MYNAGKSLNATQHAFCPSVSVLEIRSTVTLTGRFCFSTLTHSIAARSALCSAFRSVQPLSHLSQILECVKQHQVRSLVIVKSRQKWKNCTLQGYILTPTNSVIYNLFAILGGALLFSALFRTVCSKSP